MDNGQAWNAGTEGGACMFFAWSKDGKRHVERFHDIADLAARAARIEKAGISTWSAVGGDGQRLERNTLLRLGWQLLDHLTDPWSTVWGMRYGMNSLGALGYARRAGPVHGVGRPRGGHYYRRLATAGAKRGAQAMPEEGEPEARAAQNPKNLPDSWDEYPRCLQKSWKSQCKGRKSWDRARR